MCVRVCFFFFRFGREAKAERGFILFAFFLAFEVCFVQLFFFFLENRGIKGWNLSPHQRWD